MEQHSTAINEKARQETYASDLSLLFHSLFGLDHYPNYLYRWNEAEITSLQQELQHRLDEVRAQKQPLSKN